MPSAATLQARLAAGDLQSGIAGVAASADDDLHADMFKTRVNLRGAQHAVRLAPAVRSHARASVAAAPQSAVDHLDRKHGARPRTTLPDAKGGAARAASAPLQAAIEVLSEDPSDTHPAPASARPTHPAGVRHAITQWLLDHSSVRQRAWLSAVAGFAASYGDRSAPELAHDLFVTLQQVCAAQSAATAEDDLESQFERFAAELYKAMPTDAKIAFAGELKRLVESDRNCAPLADVPLGHFRFLYQALFSALGQSERPADLPLDFAFESAMRVCLLGSACAPEALTRRKIAVTGFFSSIAAAAQDAVASSILTTPRSQVLTMQQDWALRESVPAGWLYARGGLAAAVEAVPVPGAGLDRSFAFVVRSYAYQERAKNDLARRDGDRLLVAAGAALRAFTRATGAALAQGLHDVRPAQVIALCDEIAIRFKDGPGKLAVIVDETANLPLPATDQPELRAQTLELRGMAIAHLMGANLAQPLAAFLTARLPAGAIARADALALRGAVWRELGVVLLDVGVRQKRELFASRYGYNLTFAAHPVDERRMLRANLCDAFFEFDKGVCCDTLVLDLARLNKNKGALERRLDCCADLLHIDALRVANTATARRAFDEMLCAFAEMPDSVTRANRMLDLARAAGALLSPVLVVRIRDALAGSERLTSSRSAESKAEGPGRTHDDEHASAPASVPQAMRAADLDGVRKVIFQALSPQDKIDFCIAQTRAGVAAGPRAEQLSSLFEQLYLADEAMLGPSAANRAFFQAQVNAVLAHGALTQAEKDAIASCLRSLRIDHNAME